MLIDREQLVCIGKVADAHGLHGELKVKPLTGTPTEVEVGSDVLVDGGRGLHRHAVQRVRWAGTHWVLALEGLTSRDAAQRLKAAELLVHQADLRPLEEGEYFLDDLIGCTVRDGTGKALGEVTGVMETGANDVLEVRTAQGETLVPMTAEVVRRVDVDGRAIHIEPLPGLFEAE